MKGWHKDTPQLHPPIRGWVQDLPGPNDPVGESMADIPSTMFINAINDIYLDDFPGRKNGSTFFAA